MAVKKHYGIYLAYPPTLDLRDQGLGRYLAMFLKGAATLEGVRFTILCPSWSKNSLDALFCSERVPESVVNIATPAGKPYALIGYEYLLNRQKKPPQRRWFKRATVGIKRKFKAMRRLFIIDMLKANSALSLATLLFKLILAIILIGPFVLLALPLLIVIRLFRILEQLKTRFTNNPNSAWAKSVVALRRLIGTPKDELNALKIFDEMIKIEVERMLSLGQSLKDVKAWYCPTAFWPHFNAIDAPRLMCVPDVVLQDFPTGFANVGGERIMMSYASIKEAIRGGDYFATYSETVKWKTLVDNCGVSASKVFSIPHAPSDLHDYVEVTGFPEPERTSRAYCRNLLRNALSRSTNPGYTASFDNMEVKFLFYASQIRPNKNVLMLLRAYKHLLRKRFIGHKLFLTGKPGQLAEVERFINEHHLENDVIFLPGLSVSVLAACYKLADLAVNPTLSEGGCPFTFSEALSVGTPVVMSRIDVTTEVLTDKTLQEISLFDPYDWRDCANRIEWALNNREALLSVQLTTYNRLRMRSWTNVVAEHVEILDRISEAEVPVTNQ